MEPQISLDLHGHVALITINRPTRMNALDPAASSELSAAFDRVRDDEEIWVAVLTGSGERAFSVGFDLKWGRENPGVPFESINGPHGFGGLTLRRDLTKPVIAAVRGYCLGGGFELALASDMIVAGTGAKFGSPEPKVGNVAAWGGVHRLARSLPRSAANRILLACETLTAQEALELGLVYKVVPDDQVQDAALKLAQTLCQASPLSLQATKALYLDAFDRLLIDAIASVPYHPAMVKLHASMDHEEGNRAFTERREPRWTGR